MAGGPQAIEGGGVNGKPWIPEKHDQILKNWAGRASDTEIATITGHTRTQVCKRRNQLNLPSFHPGRVGWTRRDYLLASAAGWAENGE